MHPRLTIWLWILIAGCTTPSIIATKSIREGDLMNNLNRYEEAIQHYEQFLRISPQLGLHRNHSQEADVCRKLAHAYATQGRYRQSLSYLSKALGIDSTLSTNALEVIDDYRELGVVNAYMGNYREALRYLNTSLQRSERMQNSAKDIRKATLADTYLSLAQVHLTLGNFREAEDFGERALAIYTNIPGESAGRIECNLLLGIVHRHRSNLEEAVRLVSASESIARANNLNTARQHQALAEVYFLQGDTENGIRESMRAIQEAERSQIRPQMVMMYMRMGDAYQKLGDPAQAEYFYQKAMSLKVHMDADTLGFVPSSNMRFAEAQRAFDYYARSGATLGMALVSLRLGELRLQRNEVDSAALMFDAALEGFRKADSKEGMAKVLMELSSIALRKNEPGTALRNLEEARALTIQPDLMWQIEMRRGKIEELQGDAGAAYQSYRKAVGIIEGMRGNISIEELKTLFANTKVEAYDRLIVLLLTSEIPGLSRDAAVREAFGINELSRSRTFLDMLGNKKIEPKNIADTALLEREQLLRLKIQQLTKQQATGDAALIAEELERTQREYDHTLATIKLNNPAYSTVTNVEPPALDEIQSALDARTAVLEYWVSEENLVIWLLSKRGLEVTTLDIGRQNLQRLVRGCRNAVAYRDNTVTQTTLNKLHQLLIAPVQDQLRGFRQIVVVPHRSLHFLPFQALISEKKQFLTEQFLVTYAPSSSILYYCLRRNNKPGSAFLGMALADLQLEQHANLPATKQEVELLAQLYPDAESKFGDACAETFVKENADDFNYVHIATHGVFNEQEPVYSYLLMAPTDEDDGRLTVNEIFSLDINSRLVTLSACETALGDLSEGDELVGLSRAFIYAGSSAVLVSLWKVQDNTTALLMARFHEHLTSGKSAAEALSLAQRDMIHQRALRPGEESPLATLDHPVDHPYYWAPFILVGNGQAQ